MWDDWAKEGVALPVPVLFKEHASAQRVCQLFPAADVPHDGSVEIEKSQEKLSNGGICLDGSELFVKSK